MQCLNLLCSQQDVKTELKYSQNFHKWFKDRKSAQIVLQKIVFFTRLFRNLQLFCICNQNPLKLPVKEVSFSNAAALQHATLLKNVHCYKCFSRILTPQVKNSSFVKHAQNQWLLLEFIYLFTTLFNVGHTIVTKTNKNQLNKQLIHATQEQ